MQRVKCEGGARSSGATYVSEQQKQRVKHAEKTCREQLEQSHYATQCNLFRAKLSSVQKCSKISGDKYFYRLLGHIWTFGRHRMFLA